MALSSPPPPVIAIVGPTATGKTALAMALSAQLKVPEVISADSRVIYRGLDIGTAKPSPEELAQCPHAMVDITPPTEAFTAAQYRTLATPVVENLLNSGHPAIVVGGTGFYLNALLYEETLPSVPPNPAFRAHLQAIIETKGLAILYHQLMEKDPLRASQLYPQDAARIIRALEIIETTGHPVPQISGKTPRYPTIWLGLTYENRTLHRNIIANRVDAMLAAGWQEEVRELINQYGPNAHALTATHGYPELVSVVQGTKPLAEARLEVIHQVCQYARRQRTWFNANQNIFWYKVDSTSNPPESILNWAVQIIKQENHCYSKYR